MQLYTYHGTESHFQTLPDLQANGNTGLPHGSPSPRPVPQAARECPPHGRHPETEDNRPGTAAALALLSVDTDPTLGSQDWGA